MRRFLRNVIEKTELIVRTECGVEFYTDFEKRKSKEFMIQFDNEDMSWVKDNPYWSIDKIITTTEWDEILQIQKQKEIPFTYDFYVDIEQDINLLNTVLRYRRKLKENNDKILVFPFDIEGIKFKNLEDLTLYIKNTKEFFKKN